MADAPEQNRELAELLALLRWQLTTPRSGELVPMPSGLVMLPASAFHPPAGRLRIDGERLLLDGEPVPLDMTPEAREKALTYLRYLIGAAGNYISDGDIDRAEHGRPGGLLGTRWDRVRARLPASVRALINTHKRMGSRLDAWRK
jgi:hypothetical protein